MSDDEAVFRAGEGWGSERSRNVLEVYDITGYAAELKDDEELARELALDRACDESQK